MLFLIKYKEEADGRKWLKRRDSLGHTSSYQNSKKPDLQAEENRSQGFKREMGKYRENQCISCLDSFFLPSNGFLD